MTTVSGRPTTRDDWGFKEMLEEKSHFRKKHKRNLLAVC